VSPGRKRDAPGIYSPRRVTWNEASRARRCLYVQSTWKSEGGAGDRAQFPAAGAAPGDAAFAGEIPSPMSAARC